MDLTAHVSPAPSVEHSLDPRLLVVVEADSQDSGFGAHALRCSAQEQVSVVVVGQQTPLATCHMDFGSRGPYPCERPQFSDGPRDLAASNSRRTPSIREEPPCPGCGSRSDQQTAVREN